MEIDPAELYRLRYQEGLPRLRVPFFAGRVAAGFPSPADDYIEMQLDLNDLCIQHPNATFFARATGLSMINAGILPGDVLVIDRAVEPQDGSIVVALLDGGFTVKRYSNKPGQPLMLVAENEDYPPIVINEYMGFEVWGVVVSTVRVMSKKSALTHHIARHLR